MALPSLPFAGREPPCLTRRCSACCHDTEMLLTNADVVRLAAVVGDEPFWRETDGYLELVTRDAPPVPGHTGRTCWFLGPDGRCTVHDARPAGCRLYPAVWDVDAEQAVLDAEHCPHTDGFRLPRAAADAVRRLAVMLERERDARVAGSQEE